MVHNKHSKNSTNVKVKTHTHLDINYDKQYTTMHNEISELYNQDKYMFVDETQTFNDTTYNFILMHDFEQMQKAKKDLQKQGYYNQ